MGSRGAERVNRDTAGVRDVAAADAFAHGATPDSLVYD